MAHGREVATLLRGATHAVAFTGAGISMEHGSQMQGGSRGFSKLKKEKKKQKQRKKKNAQALYFKSDLPPCAFVNPGTAAGLADYRGKGGKWVREEQGRVRGADS